jgi:thiamine-monophosphate kinase
LQLQGIARAAMDISDGLVQDASHMARASGVSLVLDICNVPLSAAGRARGIDFVASGAAGGDDYELLLAVPPDNKAALLESAAQHDVAVTCIGRFEQGAAEVRAVNADGAAVELGHKGWSHF